MITAKPPGNNHNCCAFFGYAIIRHVNLFSDRHSPVGPQHGKDKLQNMQHKGQIEYRMMKSFKGRKKKDRF
jgi:hypothetical protein